MNKELETHIQQMAEPYGIHVSANSSYIKGFYDADAVGFADWCDENYHKDNNTLWFNRYDNEPKGFSIEELYLTYLKTKTK